MNKSYEVEYCNLELRFDRRHIQQLIRDLIQDGYSLYWSENESLFIISVRTGRKLTKLRFQRLAKGYKLVGDYVIRDVKLAEWLEKLIGDLRGHAVVKRIRDRQILVENILFGEVIRLVEISGMEHRVIFQKGPIVDMAQMAEMFASEAAEERLAQLQKELDTELERLFEAIQQGDAEASEACKERLRKLRMELMQLEW
ncbi:MULTISPECIES: hypothetical protein [Paenibacillus]|uniref:hypothetical protein n=1 Tax=Paenibacillus TaxID=44249 RepID=UPI0001AFD4E4|nr:MULTISPECIES: hypothetical protein [Paenibacillus]EES72776.1 hypothetical protein POTG_02476 [Paenibacillus sp. oral taxon 786 str. D14]MCT2196934.1 hypothetical protein [Paenibacillus sp. p3-SID1389]MEC2344113.1 hypothetical protein [Paenibacillus barengoltzii]SMF57250.1 hypothetical protein SAMN02744102_03963 [Paenibacillus barengoltzii]